MNTKPYLNTYYFLNNIMDIEKNRLKQCSNIIQVARILLSII